jgi:membrane protein required for colicin V production
MLSECIFKFYYRLSNMANMQVYDIIILILVGWLTLRGAMKGMVSQLASIAAVIASFGAAVRFGPVLQPIMRSTFNAQEPWDKVLALTIAFVGASIAVMFMKSIVTKIISAIRMNKFDSLCGALFGFLKGVLIGMIITFFAVMLSEKTRELAMQSHSGKILARLIQRTQTLLPEDVGILIEKNLEGFQQQLDSGKDILSQADDVSKTLSNGQKALDFLQKTATSITKPFSERIDPADKQPSLPDETKERRYPLPGGLLTLNRPSAQETESMLGVEGGTSRGGIIPIERFASLSTTTPNPTSSIQFNTSSTYSNLTRSDTSPILSISTLIVAPSADLQPMTSTSTPPLSSGTDWKTFFREMK